jgi:uncharacterized protein
MHRRLICFTLVLASLLAGPHALVLATEQEDKDDYRELPDEPDAEKNPVLPFDIELPQFQMEKEKDVVVHGGITILGKSVAPASSTRLSWEPQDTFESIAAPTPVLVMNGATPGPTLCLTGAVHGDEINGIEIIRQVFFELNPRELSGVLLGVPIVNQMGFRRASRYLPDRRDLNRYFPGHPKGSSASRIAHAFFHEIIVNCDALVDLHTGSFDRTNVPQLRGDMTNEKVAQLVHGFGGMIVLHSAGAKGMLRRAAVEYGIPSVTLEAGEPSRIQEEVVADGVQRIRNLMTNLGMYRRPMFWSSAEPVYLNSRWVRTEQGGLLISKVKLGDSVVPGATLGQVVNPINNEVYLVRAPFSGRVIGMALNQVVMPGYAAYHIGIETTEESLKITGGKDGEKPGVNGSPAPSEPKDVPEFE